MQKDKIDKTKNEFNNIGNVEGAIYDNSKLNELLYCKSKEIINIISIE